MVIKRRVHAPSRWASKGTLCGQAYQTERSARRGISQNHDQVNCQTCIAIMAQQVVDALRDNP